MMELIYRWGGWVLLTFSLGGMAGHYLAVWRYFYRLNYDQKRLLRLEKFSTRINQANLAAMTLLEDAIDGAGCGESVPAMKRTLDMLKSTEKKSEEG